MERSEAPLFTLVMCLYDVEGYVAKAVRSIREQSFEDWELLIVDDAARDKSVLRALRAAGRDPRIRFIHNDHNRGLMASRNLGLDRARGRYVAFPDAEDIAGPGYLQLAADAIERDGADVVVEGVVSDFYNTRGEVAYSEEYVPKACVAHGDEAEALVLPLEEKRLMAFIFSKFFRRELVGDLRFEADAAHFAEDFYFTLEMFERAQTVSVVGEAPYRFQKHLRRVKQVSLTTGTFLERHRRTAALQLHQEKNGLDTPESRSRLGAIYARHILAELERLSDPDADIPHERREAWVEFLREDPLFQMLIIDAEPTPGLFKSLLHKALVSNSSSAALAIGHLSGYLKSFGPETYSRTQL